MGAAPSRLNPGDMIEFYPLSDTDNHWAVYLGQGYIIHLKGSKVSIESIRDVAPRFRVTSNNKYDHFVTPLALSQIQSNAKDEVELWHRDFGAEKFAALMRYGPSSQALFMDLGDLIEMQCQGGVLWAVYTGHGNIVRLMNGKVEKIPLPTTCVYKVNNKYDRFVEKEGSVQIVAKTLKEVGKVYENSKASNESFATKMRYGICLEGPFPELGDLIEMQCQGVVLWAVYTGHGNITRFIDGKVEKIPLPNTCVYKVNNKYDNFMRNESSDQIVAKTLEEVGKVYEDSKASNESFAAKMRYSTCLEGPFPKLGDLIEYQRGFYQHWAVYIGHGIVVHLTGRGIEALSLSASRALGNFSALEGTAEVKKDYMEEVANGSRYKVNNQSDRIKKPFSPQQIVNNALSRVGESRWYHALKANCEHFVTEIRYGEGMSEQTKQAVAAATGITGVTFAAGAVALSGVLLQR